MRLRISRLGVAFAAFALVVTTGGCGGSDPAPQPAPKPRYQQTPDDLCHDLRLSTILEQFDLDLPSDYEPDRGPRTERTHWRQLCTFIAYGTDDRFATAVGEFRPAGAVQVRIYHDVAGAVEAYEQDVYSYFDLREETVPGTTTTDLAGWWGDSGKSLETVQMPGQGNLAAGPVAIHDIQVVHLIRHENLVVMADHDAIAPLLETDEALALLQDLTSALIDETVSHLDG